jgi:hypothetical protein
LFLVQPMIGSSENSSPWSCSPSCHLYNMYSLKYSQYFTWRNRGTLGRLKYRMRRDVVEVDAVPLPVLCNVLFWQMNR